MSTARHSAVSDKQEPISSPAKPNETPSTEKVEAPIPQTSKDEITVAEPNEYLEFYQLRTKVFEGMAAATLAALTRFRFDTKQKQKIAALTTNSASSPTPNVSFSAPFLAAKSPLAKGAVSSFSDSAKINVSKSTVTTHRNATHDAVKNRLEPAESEKTPNKEIGGNEQEGNTQENKFVTTPSIIFYASLPISFLDTALTAQMQSKKLIIKANNGVAPEFYNTLPILKKYAINTRVNFHTHLTKNFVTAASLLFIDNQNANNNLLTSGGIVASAVVTTGFAANLVDIVNYHKLGMRNAWSWSGNKIVAPSIYTISKDIFVTHGIRGFFRGLPWSIAAIATAFTTVHAADRAFKYGIEEKADGSVEISEKLKKSCEFFTKQRSTEGYFLSPHGFFYYSDKQDSEKSNNIENNLATFTK